MAFDFGQALKRTGEGTVKAQASQALGIPIVGFDPASLGISAGIVAGSWAVSKLLGSLFGDNTPPPIQTLDIQLADEFPIPYRIGYHRYTGQLLYATADESDMWPTELDDRIQNTRRGARGSTDTETPNMLDLVYHLSAGKIYGSTETPSLGGIYIGEDYVELTRVGGVEGTVDIFGGRGRDRSDVAREQGRYYSYCYVTVYRGYDDAAGFTEVIARSGGEWAATDTDENHSFAVVTLLDYQDTSPDAFPTPWGTDVPQIQFVGPGIELPDLSDYTATAPNNPYTSTQYTNNLASVMYWVLTTWPEGPRIAHNQFDHRSVYSAYRRCADLIDNQLPAGYAQTEGIFPKKSKRYVFNGTIRAGDEWSRTLADLDAGWLGSVYPQDGYWRFYAGGNAPQRDEETLVIHAKDATRPVSYLTQPRREERFNVAHFTLPQSQPHSYQQAPPTIVKYPQAIAREGGEEIIREISLRGVTDPGAATRLATDFLRLRNVRTLTANISGAEPDWRTLKPYEAVYLTDDKHNIENIPMIVEKKTLNQDGSTSLILKHDPPDSFSDSQELPVQTRIGQRGGRSNPPTNVQATLDFVDVRGQRALRGRVTCALDRGYDWIDVQWRKASEPIGAAQTVRNDLRRAVRSPVVFLPGIEPNIDYLIAVRVGVSSNRTGSGWTEIAWNSGDDIRALPNPVGLQVTGIIGGAYIEFTPVDIDAEPYYKRTEIKVFVGNEVEARTPVYSMGSDHIFGGLNTNEEHTLRIEARHETKSGVFSGIATASTTTLTAASAASGFLGLNAWGKQMIFNTFQSLPANVNANGRWGLSKALTWQNLKTLAATDTLSIYQAGTAGENESAYLDTLEMGDYLTFYLSELQNVTIVLAAITRNNVGTVSNPRYRYDINATAIANTLRENPVPVLAVNTELTMRFSRAVSGVDGTDGAGIEYIFCKNNDTTLPTNQYPLDSWGYDSGGTRNSKVWSDGAPELDATDPVLFRAQRKIVGSPNTGDAVTDTWTTPVVVGRIGLDGSAAQAGEDGRGVEYVFQRTASASAPRAPSNTRPYDPVTSPDSWSDGAPTLTSALPILWRCSRLVPGLPARGATYQSSWGNWTSPRIVGRYGADGPRGQQGLTGAQGEDGTDGQGVEFRYAVTQTAVRPNPPDFSLRFDAFHSTWQDGAPAINNVNQYRWVTQRKVPGTPSSTEVPNLSTGWGRWTTPQIVGRWGQGTPGDPGPRGPQGIAGAAGDDGVGVEYIFTTTTTNSLSSSRYPSNSWGYDTPSTRGGQRWYDAAPNLSASAQFLWRSERKTEGIPATGTQVSESWSRPVIVGRYGEDGAQGAKGDTGDDGDPGVGIEYVFARFPLPNLTSTLHRPDNTWRYGTGGGRRASINRASTTLQWHTTTPELHAGFHVLVRSERKVSPSGNTFVRDGNWSVPVVISNFASASGQSNGSGTLSSSDLVDGSDFVYGLSTQSSIFRLGRTEIFGSLGGNANLTRLGYFVLATVAQMEGTAQKPVPTAGRGTDRITGWSNSRPSPGAGQYVWAAQRFLFFSYGTDYPGLGNSTHFRTVGDNLGYFYWYFPAKNAPGPDIIRLE